MIYPALNVPLYLLPKFEFVRFLELLEKYRVTAIAAVPPR